MAHHDHENQKIALAVSSGDGRAGEIIGPKFNINDLVELGLDEDAMHVKLEFDHGKTVSYLCCLTYLGSTFFSVILLLFCPCIYYGIYSSTHSRKAAVTERQLVLKQGAYGCFCCCWGEKTKSVSLEKITDLSISQGCLQRCYDVKSLSVENASSGGNIPEMVLIGLVDPEGIRKMVLRTRDNNGFGGANNANRRGGNNLNNPLLNDPYAAQTYQVNMKQAQELQDIKSLLIGVKQSIDTLNRTMSRQ
eukprot:104961_1